MSFFYSINNKNVCFIHIPKTGGKSVAKALNPLTPQHRPHKKYTAHHTLNKTIKIGLPDNKEYIFFTCIRNPWDRAVSFFHYISQNPQMSGVPELGRKISSGEIGFGRFIEIMTSNSSMTSISSKFMRPQYDYIKNKLEIDVSLIRTEYLQEDLAKFFYRCGKEKCPQIPHINKSSHNHYSTYYNNHTINLISEYESEIIKSAGYVFKKP